MAKVELELDENGFIPGTTFKSIDDLMKGHTNLKETLDRQGNELGTLRKDYDTTKTQSETLAGLLREQMGKGGEKAKGEPEVDFDSELMKVESEIQNLDPLKEDYQKTLASLVSKSNRLVAGQQHQKTMAAASELMNKELSERDVKSAQEAFHRENPTFNTPEMQAKIREYIAKDRTGMADPLSAFREIQRDEVAARAAQLETENAEYKRLIDLNKGKDESGKVVVKNNAGGGATKPAKVTGKDLDEGMRAALRTTAEP